MRQNTILCCNYSRYNRPSMEIIILTMIQMAVDIIMPHLRYGYNFYNTIIVTNGILSIVHKLLYFCAFELDNSIWITILVLLTGKYTVDRNDFYFSKMYWLFIPYLYITWYATIKSYNLTIRNDLCYWQRR